MDKDRKHVPFLARKEDGTEVVVAGQVGYVTAVPGLFVVPGVWYSIEADTFLPHNSYLVATMGEGDEFGVTVVDSIATRQEAFNVVELLATLGDWYTNSRNLIGLVPDVLDTTGDSVVA